MEEYVLFEYINGYTLFKLLHQEPLVGVSFDDLQILKSTITLVSHYKFDSFNTATQNLLEISKLNSLPNELKSFLTVNNVKKLYCDKSLFVFLKELGIKTKQSDSLMRGIRLNYNKLVKDDNSFLLGAAHDFSREKIEYSDKKEDSLIIQSVLIIDQLRIDLDFFMKKIYNLYDFYFPELKDLVEKEDYFKIARILNGKISFDKLISKISDKFGEEISNKVKEGVIYSIGPISNGTRRENEFRSEDLRNLDELLRITEEKQKILNDLEKYLTEKLEIVAPNLLALVGPYLAGKLIAQSGSLINLAKAPSSTVQLLGAEAALFRSLKTRSKTPKHGILFFADEVIKSKKKGKVSRCLATKISLVAKIDYFSEKRTNLYGVELKKVLGEVIKGKKVDLTEVMKNISEKISK